MKLVKQSIFKSLKLSYMSDSLIYVSNIRLCTNVIKIFLQTYKINKFLLILQVKNKFS